MRYLLPLGLVVASLLSCKSLSTDGSEAKSLDRFSSTPTAEPGANFCGSKETTDHSKALLALYKNKIVVTKAGPGEWATTVAQTLVNVPPVLLLALLDDSQMGGTIEVTPETASKCQKAMTDAQKNPELAKYMTDPATTKTAPIRSCVDAQSVPVKIYVTNDSSAIRDALVRSVGFAVVEGVEKFKTVNSKKTLIAAWSADFDKKVRDLGVTFLKVIQANAKNAENFASWSGIDIPKTITKRMANLSADEQHGFLSMIFAETFDSYYCSLGTKMTIDTGEWKQLGPDFMVYHNQMNITAQAVMNAVKKKPSAHTTLIVNFLNEKPAGAKLVESEGLALGNFNYTYACAAGTVSYQGYCYTCNQGYMFYQGLCYPQGYSTLNNGNGMNNNNGTNYGGSSGVSFNPNNNMNNSMNTGMNNNMMTNQPMQNNPTQYVQNGMNQQVQYDQFGNAVIANYSNYNGQYMQYQQQQAGFWPSTGRAGVAVGRFLTFRWGRLGRCGGVWNC